MKVRIKFRKNGSMRFVGHLDIMRYFQKALRRAGIDVAYTEGFSPHQIMSFAAPLGVGLTSDGEYMDIEVRSPMSSAASVEALNGTMADGMEIASFVALREGSKKAMTAVAAADYIVYFKKREDFAQTDLPGMMRAYYTEREQIEIVKQSKKSERIIDLKPLIYRFEPYADEDDRRLSPDRVLSVFPDRRGFFLRLCTGSTDNIKPELVLSDFYSYFGREYDPFNLQIHRLEIYERVDGRFSPLDAAGDIIENDRNRENGACA
ncbi:MAG: TIGR03936 family radical SAM-associated protein [Clostridiales bacterium]|nr:TIGR03936 family radical SAM-associated protein [Clostridiales bacterium]